MTTRRMNPIEKRLIVWIASVAALVGRLKDSVIAPKPDRPAAINVNERYSLLDVLIWHLSSRFAIVSKIAYNLDGR